MKTDIAAHSRRNATNEAIRTPITRRMTRRSARPPARRGLPGRGDFLLELKPISCASPRLSMTSAPATHRHRDRGRYARGGRVSGQPFRDGKVRPNDF